MGFVAQNPGHFAGQAVGSGQCVAFVERAAGAPLTAQWRRGAQVKDSHPPAGTAIATFDPDGIYGNHIDGRSHAAIFLEQNPGGLLVWDQWSGHPVSQRIIRFNNAGAQPVNQGEHYYVIET